MFRTKAITASLAGGHTVPEHAVGLLFPAGWASSLVDTLCSTCSALSWVSTTENAPLSHMHMQAAGRHLVCPLSKWMSARAPGRRLVGFAGLGRAKEALCLLSLLLSECVLLDWRLWGEV